MSSVKEHITDKLKVWGEGSIFFVSDFYSNTINESAVRKNIERLAKDETLIKISNGIYLYPKRNPKLGIVLPSLEQIATKIADRDKARIVPSGAYALNLLGFSTQVPTVLTYLTDGSPRKIKIGNGQIVFRKTSPKSLSYKNSTLSLIVQALKELGEKNITEEERKKFIRLAKKETITDFAHDILLAPKWIQKILNATDDRRMATA